MVGYNWNLSLLSEFTWFSCKGAEPGNLSSSWILLLLILLLFLLRGEFRVGGVALGVAIVKEGGDLDDGGRDAIDAYE